MLSLKNQLIAYNIRPAKRLGQNFLKDSGVIQSIVSAADIKPEDTVVEIGAGFGSLTIPLARAAKAVFAYEKDKRLIPLLTDNVYRETDGNVTIIQQDFLAFDSAVFTEQFPCKPVIIGNLPYNISSQALLLLIRQRAYLQKAVLMFQKELADRLMALPGCSDYSRITAILRYAAHTKRLLKVDAECFYPKPKIDSTVLEICFNKIPEIRADNETLLLAVIKAAFGQRRKTLKNAIAGSELRLDPSFVQTILDRSGIDYTRRAETLTETEFCVLSNEFLKAMPENSFDIPTHQRYALTL